MAVTLSMALAISMIACQKNERPAQVINQFNEAAAKEWYYGTFKKSQEWASSPQHGKKLPNWKFGLYKKIADMEVVEFPLVQAKKTTSVPSAILSSEEKKKIFVASLSKILFIKKRNKTFVREIDYIPDYEYLRTKNFDISDVSILKSNNQNFSGRIRIKDWKGNVIALRMLENGRIVKQGEIKTEIRNSSQSRTNDGCYTIETCDWQMDCDVTTYPDGLQTWECGEPYLLGCSSEEWCAPVSCNGSPDCECLEYGICGGDDNNNECEATELDQATQEYYDYIKMATVNPVTENVSATSDGPDPIIGSTTWTVVRALSGSWEIRSNCDYKYYHSKYMTTDFHWVDEYDLFYFQSGDGYYVGSNTLITSTYTTTTATTNDVINNNTSNTTGVSHVRGVVKHECNLKIRFPFCDPITLRSEDEVDNYLYLHPK